MATNIYKTRRGYLENPCTPLYQDNDVEISQADHVQKLLVYLEELDSKIAGDFETFDLIGEFWDNQLSYIRNGAIAFKIKYFRLHREVAGNFHEFCQKFFHKGADYINLQIQAASDAVELISHGFGEILPQNEAQMRSLRHSAKKAGLDIVTGWQRVCDLYKEKPWKITHKTIETAILPEIPEDPQTLQKVVLPILVVDHISKLAEAKKMGFTEFLEDHFGVAKSTDNLLDQKRMEKWEEEEEANQDYYQERLDSA